MAKKVLFLVAHRPGRSPGQRFRFEQYIDYLRANGYQCDVSFLINDKDDSDFYAPGRYLSKARILFKTFWRRLSDMDKAGQYDLVFIYREVHMLGVTWFERFLKGRGVKMILDFDDSIWINDTSDGNRQFSWLKRPMKTAEIAGLCDMVLVGNGFLEQWTLPFNNQVHVIPTTIDTQKYVPSQKSKTPGEKICIGWTGSATTMKHLQVAVPFLREIQQMFRDQIIFRVISNKPLAADLLGLENVAWNAESEVEDLYPIDIGIMPLPDNEWTRGKCGFKGLQYMALEIPTIMSPVGVNSEIITDGVNGFLANEPREWVKKLSALIESPELRSRLGKAGRQTVIDRYSFDSQKERYLKLFNSLIVS